MPGPGTQSLITDPYSRILNPNPESQSPIPNPGSEPRIAQNIRSGRADHQHRHCEAPAVG